MTANVGILSRASVTLVYLLAVLLLGGASAAGFAANLVLQLGGALLVGLTLWQQPGEARLPTGLKAFGIALAVLAIVQFLPLPPGLWPHLPGRDAVAQGFAMLDVPLPWQSYSLAPWKSLASLAWWLPALALFVSMRAEGAPSTRAVLMVVITVAIVSTLMGMMQRGSGQAYLYEITNFGEGPGFFANSNHQGSFLLVSLSLIGGYLASLGQGPQRRGSEWLLNSALPLSAGLVLTIGVLLSGSLACLMLLVPVAIGLVLMARPGWRVSGPVLAIGLVIFITATAAFLLFVPVSNDLAGAGATPGISRREFLDTGLRILRDFAPFGTGLGTFQDIYRWYEMPANVGTVFVNHAHDDLLELLVETGIFGLAALGLFLAWFLPRAWSLWTGEGELPMARAASLAIATVLAHSLVDYPLRTAAMSSLVAIACVIMVRPEEDMRSRKSRRRRANPEDGRELIRI